jgi:hypothetical protein
MAITTYAELQTQIAGFLDRTDLPVTTFIALAEATMNRKLRHWRMEARTTSTVSARFVDLPSGWRETVRLSVPRRELDLIPDAEIATMRANAEDTAGEPAYYAFTAGQIELYPTPDGDYTLEHVYLGEIAALSDSNTSNWVLEEAPDAYLYGALKHSAPYLVEDQRVAVWEGMFQQALAELQLAGKKAAHSGSGLKIKVR